MSVTYFLKAKMYCLIFFPLANFLVSLSLYYEWYNWTLVYEGLGFHFDVFEGRSFVKDVLTLSGFFTYSYGKVIQ